MAGHNKWSQIKHKKGHNDLKRGKIFSKIGKEIAVAVRQSGDNPQNNFRLRAAINWAKSENMPLSNINRAINTASKANDNDELLELIYEGYGPGSVALLVECLSDNRNRTISSIRNIFGKHNGQITPMGSTQHIFTRLNFITVAIDECSESKLIDILSETDVIELDKNENYYQICCSFDESKNICDSLKNANIKINIVQFKITPTTKVVVKDKEIAAKNLELINALDDDDDVQHVFTNIDISPNIIEQINLK